MPDFPVSQMQKDIHDITIIGAGPTGLFGAFYFYGKGQVHAGSAMMLLTFIFGVGVGKFFGVRKQSQRIEGAALEEKINKEAIPTVEKSKPEEKVSE